MRAAISKAEIESTIAARFADAFKHHQTRPSESLPTGITNIDALSGGGLPRGAITEIFGPASSGRTSLMLSMLATATNNDEVCAVIDMNNAFDPQSAERAQVNFEQLLWVRCDNNLEHAFKATDLVLQGGGFGIVLLDLGDLSAKASQKIISSWWYRFRRVVENTPTALLVITQACSVRSCAALSLEMKNEAIQWLHTHQASNNENVSSIKSLRTIDNREVTHGRLLGSLTMLVTRHRPVSQTRRETTVQLTA